MESMPTKRTTEHSPELVATEPRTTETTKRTRHARAKKTEKSVSDMIREDSRTNLSGRFDDFLQRADPEEIRLMESILGTWDSGIVHAIEGVDEVPLGEAFEFELSRNETYVRVPREMRQQAQDYINGLRAIADKAVI
jgi:hypothetical protein